MGYGILVLAILVLLIRARFVSEIKVSLNVEAKSLEAVSISAAERRVVELTKDNDLTS